MLVQIVALFKHCILGGLPAAKQALTLEKWLTSARYALMKEQDTWIETFGL